MRPIGKGAYVADKYYFCGPNLSLSPRHGWGVLKGPQKMMIYLTIFALWGFGAYVTKIETFILLLGLPIFTI